MKYFEFFTAITVLILMFSLSGIGYLVLRDAIKVVRDIERAPHNNHYIREKRDEMVKAIAFFSIFSIVTIAQAIVICMSLSRLLPND